jgi:hypothetical protein
VAKILTPALSKGEGAAKEREPGTRCDLLLTSTTSLQLTAYSLQPTVYSLYDLYGKIKKKVPSFLKALLIVVVVVVIL